MIKRKSTDDTTEVASEAAAPEVKKATKPGWRPAQRLGYLKARSGYTARWVNADPDNVVRKKSEGWIVMKPNDNIGMSMDVEDVNDGKAPSSEIRYRDMIAMMLPDAVKTEREEYYRGENSWAMKAIFDKSDKELSKTGAQVYTPKGQAGRIVIE